MIPEHLVEEVRQRADLVEIVSEHTRLKRSGRTFRGPCPLHGGEGPNFSVDPAKGFFKCFVCGEGGSVFTFLMKHLGMTYPEAIRDVAGRVGVEIPDPGERRREEDPHRHLHDVNAFAAKWYRDRLKEGDDGRAAREYLQRRGISEAAQERFRLGWAPEGWTLFGDAARRAGISNELLLQLGLAKEPRSGTTPYDAFRGRIVFPIEDLGGRVIAFGGRILGSAEEHVPKYLNSPESAVYSKGRTLYGLGWSRNAIRKEETALVVEGYMDLVSLAAHGVENVVAPLGTSMTEEQAEMLARYAPRVILLYDSDKAGLKATFRAGDELLRAGAEVLVATLPQGEDPDSLVREKGAAALRGYLDDAVDVLERKIQILERRDYFGSIRGTRQAVDALLPTVRAASDEILREVYIGRISEKTGISRETLEREAAEVPRGEGRGAPAQERRRKEVGRRAEDAAARAAAPSYPMLGPERNLLLLLFRDESYVEYAAREVQPEDFRNPIYAQILRLLIDREGHLDPEGTWMDGLTVEVVRAVEELRGDPEGFHLTDPDAYFTTSIREIKAWPFEDRLRRIEEDLRTGGGNAEELYRAKSDVLRQMREKNLHKGYGMMRRARRNPER